MVIEESTFLFGAGTRALRTYGHPGQHARHHPQSQIRQGPASRDSASAGISKRRGMATGPPDADGTGEDEERPRTAGGGGYYSLDAVLAEETGVPCAFRVGCAGVGRALDPSAGQSDVKAGANVELPLWLLPPLTGRDMVSIKCAHAPPAQLPHLPAPAIHTDLPAPRHHACQAPAAPACHPCTHG